MKISDVIRDRRKELGITLRYIGNKIGVSQATVQRWEVGNITTIRHNHLVKLCSILGVSPNYLFGWNKELDEEWIMLLNKCKSSGLKPAQIEKFVDVLLIDKIRNFD